MARAPFHCQAPCIQQTAPTRCTDTHLLYAHQAIAKNTAFGIAAVGDNRSVGTVAVESGRQKVHLMWYGCIPRKKQIRAVHNTQHAPLPIKG